MNNMLLYVSTFKMSSSGSSLCLAKMLFVFIVDIIVQSFGQIINNKEFTVLVSKNIKVCENRVLRRIFGSKRDEEIE